MTNVPSQFSVSPLTEGHRTQDLPRQIWPRLKWAAWRSLTSAEVSFRGGGEEENGTPQLRPFSRFGLRPFYPPFFGREIKWKAERTLSASHLIFIFPLVLLFGSLRGSVRSCRLPRGDRAPFFLCRRRTSFSPCRLLLPWNDDRGSRLREGWPLWRRGRPLTNSSARRTRLRGPRWRSSSRASLWFLGSPADICFAGREFLTLSRFSSSESRWEP